MENEDQERKVSAQDAKDGKSTVLGAVDTGGGAYVGGNVNTIGDFIGHDKHIHGDEVHGDKVMGNKIVQEALKLRPPLERPPRAAHFQDRKEILDKLIADLCPGQVITLCGPGGIGKSALAAEAVWHLAPDIEPSDRFPDGIVFHSFYNQPQAALALEHIARSFGEEIKPSPKEAAQRALAGRRALLILDGTEQADDLRMVVDIRDQCGVLLTSRTRQDEIKQRLDVTPLPLEDAVNLLQAWGRERASDTATARRISELVGRLPLALRLVGRYLAEREEYAADYLVWLKKTPLAALDQGKHSEESVLLLLMHSCAQLSEQSFQALGVVGLLALAPFTWHIIATSLTLSDIEARYALGELVNYGLLVRPSEDYEVTHALIHTYAQLRIMPSIESINRLVDYYRQFIKEQQGKFDLLNRVRPHILVLVRICLERALWYPVLTLAQAIDYYLYIQGYWTDRIILTEAGLAAARALQNRREEASLLGIFGDIYNDLGQAKQAIPYYQQALTIARELGDHSGESAWLGNMGLAYRALGQMAQAITNHQQALTLAREIGDRQKENTQLGNLGLVYYFLGQAKQAITYYQQALTIAREIGDPKNEGAWLGDLGLAYRDLGQVDQSIAYYQQALTIARELGNRHGEVANLGHLGLAYSELGQANQSITYYQQALTLARELGDKHSEGSWIGNLGLVYDNLGQAEQAIIYYQQALTIAREIDDPRNEGIWLGNLGRMYGNLGQAEQAITYYQQSLTLAREIGDKNNQAAQLDNLGNEYHRLGQYQTSIDYYEQALFIVQETGWRFGEGEVLKDMGNLYRDLNQVETARQNWEQALHIFEEIKSPEATSVRELLASLKER